MSYTFKSKHGEYCSTLPDNWEYSTTKGKTSVFDNNGVGAITISCFPSSEDTIGPEQFVLNFIHAEIVNTDQPAISQIPSAFSRVPVAYTEYQHQQDAWRVWCIQLRSFHIVVSYNCANSSKGLEDRTVDAIVNSIRDI